MRILVTGGAGFIGSHVSDRLVARGDEIVIVDSFDPFYDPAIKHRNISEVLTSDRASLIEANIADTDAIDTRLGDKPIDAIVHLAARAGVRPSLERPRDYIRTNIEGTQALLDLARRRQINRFVFGSSSSVYGDDTPVPFSESVPAVAPISPYAATKRAAELICHSYSHLYGMTIACVRLFTVYGPRQRPDLAIHKFARLMSIGAEIPVFGDGTTERDYTYVDDIVQGIEAALDWTGRAGTGSFETINLGESETTSLSRLIEMLSSALQITPQLRRMPEQPGDVKRTCADVAKAREMLGYDPRISMEEGIRRFVEWFRAQPQDARSGP